MTYPINVQCWIDFSTGATFGYPFTLDSSKQGILGTNVLANAQSVIVDVSDQVGSIKLTGGYNLLQDQFEPAVATIVIYDQNGDYNPQNVNSPYYGLLSPLRKIRVAATPNATTTTHYVFSGYVISWDYTYPKDQQIGYVTVTASDAFRLFNLANISAITGGADGQDTGARINNILDTISWPNSLRAIDTGNSLCQADPGTNRTALQALKNVEFSEQGAFYINGSGQAVFRSRHWIMSKNGANPTTFANDGSGISYANVAFAFDDKLIINQANIQPVGLTMQSAYKQTSIDKYFPHSMTQQNLVVQTEAEALNIAREYVTTRAETTIRIDAMVLDLTTPNYTTGITAALSLDYFDTVKIINVNNQGTGSTITKTLQLMGIAMDITPQKFTVTFTTSEPINDAFILDSSLYGILGNSTLGY